MSFNQKTVECIDETAKSLVIGFIRIVAMDIPIDIVNICLLFYLIIVDTFDRKLCGKLIHISNSKENGYHDTVAQATISTVYNSVIGSFIIDAAKYTNCIIQWTLNVHSSTKEFVDKIMFGIGIVEDNGCVDVNSYCFGSRHIYSDYINYGFGFFDSRRSHCFGCISMIKQQGTYYKHAAERLNDNVIKIGDN